MITRRQFLQKVSFRTGAILLASYPFFIERHLVQMNEYKIVLPSLPKLFDGFRVVHLTDIHHGILTSQSFVKRIIDKTNNLKPDAIVCTGDYVNAKNSQNEINQVWPILSHLSAKEGVYAVLGNHDHWADGELSLDWLEKSGQSVRHTSRAIVRGKDRIVIGGSGDLWEDELGIDKAFKSSDDKDFRILLSHNPDAADRYFKTPIDLMLSGHTHGGQISIPFAGPPVLPVQNKEYAHGLIKTGKTTLFISKGIGWSTLPVRFNCLPEIAVLHLVSM